MVDPIAQWARRYIETFGLGLVPIEPGEKAPKGKGWNQPGGYFTDAEVAEAFWQRHPQHNMGVVLGPSRVCSLDVDDMECTRQVLWDLLEVDLDALVAAYPTVVGNPARCRIMFRVPDGVELGRHALAWPDREDSKKRFTVLEFRAGPVQDVLPPSIHPGTGRPYTWRTPPSAAGLPELPLALLQAWQRWDIFKRDAEAACPWAARDESRPSRKAEPGGQGRSGGESVIEAFCRAHEVESLLERHGYKRRGKKWLYAASSTGLPGITVTEGRVYSHHAADPLANGHQNDAFDVFCLLEHGGDVSAATKAAARVLGLEVPRRFSVPLEQPPAPSADDYANCSADLPRTPTMACGDARAEQASALSPGGAGGFRIGEQELLNDFVLIYGTDLVWDCNRRRMVKLAALREVVGRERIKLWQESQHRRVAEDVVFDPTMRCGPTMLNLFDGFKAEQDPIGQAGCKKILAHLGRLCGNRKDEYLFLLRWIAYPLQNPGAKMATSVVMFGAEGPGKSLVWEKVVKPIYGEYGVTIGQAQLESQFTGWQSRKLFGLAEEVVSRAEMRHYKGLLKHLVTGETLQINEKMQSLREERNHLNFVFLSNSTVPLELDDGDRRYLVLYVDQVPPKEYFMELVAEIENGGVEAFYHYVMNISLEGFNEHTKPPLNAEKQALIEGSMTPPRYFLRIWERGELDLPYGAAVAGDLYKAFCRWCERSNEFKRREREFYQEIQRDLVQVRKDIRFPSQHDDFRTCRIYLPKPMAARQGEPDWLREVATQCRDFHRDLDARYRMTVEAA
ncbi:putative DNA primase/helicase [Azotobacter beijerinckii]|uniref:Putative DNA primase/helicase n=1 Tax=Azotobacter beijerinckii TaxID=170623 RepID=A0A1H6V4E5_9GAMM|nr:bifunctional DNA primase/polymerase [Azotobacter beijerinckii]SEI99418.1 putative DNA primase/helicase [Azotobacter beijerinckii]